MPERVLMVSLSGHARKYELRPGLCKFGRIRLRARTAHGDPHDQHARTYRENYQRCQGVDVG